MTTRATIVFYATAWFAGCLIAAICISIGAPAADQQHWQNSFFVLYLAGLFYSAWIAIPLAWFLLQSMSLLGWKSAWQWTLAGGAICFAATAPIASLLQPATLPPPNASWSFYLWGAPGMLNRAGVWAPPVCGALTAILLHRVRKKSALPSTGAEPESSQVQAEK